METFLIPLVEHIILFMKYSVSTIPFWKLDVFIAYFELLISRYDTVPKVKDSVWLKSAPSVSGFLTINN